MIYESRHPTRNVIEKEAGVPAGRIRLIPAALPKPFRWPTTTAVSATIGATGGVAVDRTDVPADAPAAAAAAAARHGAAAAHLACSAFHNSLRRSYSASRASHSITRPAHGSYALHASTLIS